MFGELKQTRTDSSGFYSVDNLPVGPLTFSAKDADGNVTYAANGVRSAGEVVEQNLQIIRKAAPGIGSIRGVVVRSDDGSPVTNARVGLFSQGFAVSEAYTGEDGQFFFDDVPAGFITVLAAHWSVSRQATSFDFDLAPNEVKELTLSLVVNTGGTGTLTGVVTRGGTSEVVPGALVQLEGLQVITAGADGTFTYEQIPTSLGGKKIEAYDPETDRIGSAIVPHDLGFVPILIPADSSGGSGTIRIRLVDANGNPVAGGYKVFEPGLGDQVIFDHKGEGIYELVDAPVKRSYDVWAVPLDQTYGYQYATGKAQVEFAGQVSTLALSLPGQGTVRAKVKSGSGVDLVSDVRLSFLVWNDAFQELDRLELTQSTTPDYALFEKVPANQSLTVASVHPVYGSASTTARLGYDGDLQSFNLQLSDLSTVSGTVFGIDGVTPISGATVRLSDGRQNQGAQLSAADGTFEFRNVASGTGVTVTAEITQSGIYRTGVASASTPVNGGTVSRIAVVMRRQGLVEGQVVHANYKTDPQDSSSLIPDDTPGDLSDNAPVPYARFWLREFGFPGREFGTAQSPMTADATGRFSIPNLFEGTIRVTARDPENEDNRGTWSGSIKTEGDPLTAIFSIGSKGFGTAVITVVDPNDGNAPVPNAEVTLIAGSPYEFGTTDGAGQVRFEQVLAGHYTISVFSKALGSSGAGAIDVEPIVGASKTVELEFVGAVQGTLLDSEIGPGVAGAHVDLTATEYQTRATTDEAGDFLFNQVREGTFRLDAKDTDTNRRVSITKTLTQELHELTGVRMVLEEISDLGLSIYLPDDLGNQSSALAPLVSVEVTQRCYGYRGSICEYRRALQGNSFHFEGMFRNERFKLAIKEIGGLERTIFHEDEFHGQESSQLDLVLPAYGDVRVSVLESGQPAASILVTASGGGVSKTAYTDSSGAAMLRGFPLGKNLGVQARKLDGSSSGVWTGTVTRQSVPAEAVIDLGGYATIEGLVEAEEGGPSVGTRVSIRYQASGTWVELEVRTDATGMYRFYGVPATGTTADFEYLGPDELTIGGRQSVIVTEEYESGTLTAPSVKLDATPPRLLDFSPTDGAQNVSLDTELRFVFSESIDPAVIDSSHFAWRTADGSSTVSTAISHGSTSDGNFVVVLRPKLPAGQPYPLLSDTLYRVTLSAGIRDLSRHTIAAERGITFMTADKAEPEVIAISPAEDEPLQRATTFELRYNEPIDPAAWEPGGSGSIQLLRINEPGPAGSLIEEIAGVAHVDPQTWSSLYFAPSLEIIENAFYRLTVSGVFDPEGNPAASRTFHFSSRDTRVPYLELVSPVGEQPLVSGTQYRLTPTILDEQPVEGQPLPATAEDIDRVDYFKVVDGVRTYLRTETSAPFAYAFVAPDGAATIAFAAEAWDFSGNKSNEATISFEVIANSAPSDLSITLDPSGDRHAGSAVSATVGFDDEGILVTVKIQASGTDQSGSPWSTQEVREVRRSGVSESWNAPVFDLTLPRTLEGGSAVTLTATVTDSRGGASTTSHAFNVLPDTVAPVVAITAPAAEATFEYGQTFQIEAVVRDAEVEVSSVTFDWDGQSRTVQLASSVSGANPGERIFRSGMIDVPVKNADTRIQIVATADRLRR